MSQIQIYYFSGSGNSLAVARSLASELKAELIPMASTFEQEKIRLNADVIGIVFPLYDFKAPPLVIDFIRKLEPIESAYLLAVCTNGIAVAHSLTELANTIQSCGIV